ncbi:MAG: tRNA (adenosine(37)-N6)-threonylcarbamoyltransferase complex dimerization subunit type 1 TsaB [Candidatus Krumholzibacteriota bacterium]|nr:tRNA (adenosine(37)-N6)-threonylcarbamoyltransferase complex dimerization subunit type 1 TsaB [Candidatus Krumholzibacteriota bacterium]
MTSGLILALDTSHLKGSVALSANGDLLCEIIFDASDTHSATLMPAVDTCLRQAQSRISDIDLFGLVIGPGSFTGLRIGLATVKAFASIRQKPVCTVNSMELLAAAFPYSRLPVFPLIDARRSEVYAAAYDTGSGFPVELASPRAVSPEAVVGMIKETCKGGPVLLCGTGAEKYSELLSRVIPAGSRLAGSEWSVPSAARMISLVRAREPIHFSGIPRLEPMYIRPPDAKLPSRVKLNDGGGKE